MKPDEQRTSPPGTFKEEQRHVGLAMASALVISIVVLGAAMIADRSAAALPFAERLEHSLRLDVFVILWLVATVGNVARLRFFSELDIAAGESDTKSSKVRRARAILQNTLEQTVLAVVTHAIVAATFDRSASLIAALVALFAAGRLLFWFGYKHGAARRALGFGLTFYPNVLTLLASAGAIIVD